MPAYLEIWGASGPELIPLSSDRATVGKDSSNDVVLTDKSVSRLHAVIERLGPAWCVRDLGSRNGTLVNGERILKDKVLRPGDELHLGRTRVIFRGEHPESSVTEAAQRAPALTPREKELLLALCRPVLSGNLLTEPASVRKMAAEVFLTESAVKKSLQRLYDKFDLIDEAQRKRAFLANEAIRRGAVTVADLRQSSKT